MKAMLLAAGLGTRLQPWTQQHPKALFPVHGIPLLEWNLRYLKAAGIVDVVINVHHFANQITDYLNINNSFELNIAISDESELLLETGGGIRKAQPFLADSDFLVMNVDILTDLNLSDLIQKHQKNDALATLAVCPRNSSRKLFFNHNMHLQGWKNFKTDETRGQTDGQELAFSGVHILSPSIFDCFGDEQKFSIMDTYLSAMDKHTILGYNHEGNKLIDVGKPDSGQKAEVLFEPLG